MGVRAWIKIDILRSKYVLGRHRNDKKIAQKLMNLSDNILNALLAGKCDEAIKHKEVIYFHENKNHNRHEFFRKRMHWTNIIGITYPVH